MSLLSKHLEPINRELKKKVLGPKQMNERIQELAEQAGLQPFEDCGPGYVYKMEKFAELIVRECAGIYSKIDNGNLHMGTDDYLEALHKTFRS